MNRILGAVVIAICTAGVAAQQTPPPCRGKCTATLAMRGTALVLNGAGVPFHTDRDKQLTLTIANSTSMTLQVRLTNFQIVHESGEKEPKCPGHFAPAAADTVATVAKEIPATPPSAVQAACESANPQIAPHRSASFTLRADLGQDREHYKFDLVATMIGHGGKPVTFDPELVIDANP